MTRLRAVLSIAVLLGILSVVLLVAGAEPASAHPLGNFSINRFSAIEVEPDAVSVRYVVDMAEIPTLEHKAEVDADGDDEITANELQEFARTSARGLASNLSLQADGNEVVLSVGRAGARLERGQGGLDVLRMEFEFTGRLPAPEVRLRFSDENYEGNLGWSEIVASGRAGVGIVDADVPSESVSTELRSYPRDLLTSPLAVTEATIEVSAGAGSSGAGSSGAGSSGGERNRSEPDTSGVPTGTFSSLIERDPSPAFVGFALLIALLSGALHALGPGHGKTVMAAYLLGTAGRPRHAVRVGIVVSLMHTASVIGLCLITLWAQNVIAPESVYPWLSLVSGVVVLSLGGFLLWSRLRRGVRAHDHSHGQAHGQAHGAAHDHGAVREATHDHGAAHPSPVSWRGLGAIALSGGLLPSPTALIVLLGAIALDRIAFGLVLVMGFSIGLAGALTLIGVLVLRARDFTAQRFGRRAAAVLPVMSAAAILAMGLFLTTRAALGL